MGALREMTIENNWFVEGTADASFARDKAVEMINGILFNESPPPMREIGEIAIYGSSTLPEKWLPCTGLAINRIAYAALFAVIGTTYGAGDGSNTFNIPNLTNKFPKMYNPIVAPGSEDAMGGTGGLASVTLTTAQIPAHTHTGVVSPNNPVSNRALVSTGGVQTVRAAGTSDSEGGGGSHENRPPFVSLEFMIYAGV